MLDDENQAIYTIKYDPTITAYRRGRVSLAIICDACGLKGHHASTCFRRGMAFLPRDVQRRVVAYNSKFGDHPDRDKSGDPTREFHTLPPADHKAPVNTPSTQAPIIQALQQNLNELPSDLPHDEESIDMHPQPPSCIPTINSVQRHNPFDEIITPDGSIDKKMLKQAKKFC